MREPLKLTRAHDPLLLLLALLALLGIGATLRARSQPPPPAGTTRALRLMELQLDLSRRAEAVQPGFTRKALAAGKDLTAPWDRAAWAVEAQEGGETALAETLRQTALPGPEGATFTQAWAAAYEAGPLPAKVPAPLRGTRAAGLLENRLRARQGLPALPLPAPAFARLALLGLGFLLLFLTGLGTAIVLLATLHRPAPPPPAWRMAGRGALLVFLGWLVGFFVLSTAAGLALRPLPGGRIWALPLGYLLHATFGTWLLLKVEGLTFRELVDRVAPPGRTGRALAWAPAFLGLAVAVLFVLALALSPFLKGHPNPQQEVQDLLAGAQGWPLQAALFLTLAGLAPCFEELLFRGFLLPWTGARWGGGWGLAFSSVLFGFTHLQPWALPVLAGLGFVLGLAARRSGSLWTSILVHGCWNGSLFLLLKLG